MLCGLALKPPIPLIPFVRNGYIVIDTQLWTRILLRLNVRVSVVKSYMYSFCNKKDDSSSILSTLVTVHTPSL